MTKPSGLGAVAASLLTAGVSFYTAAGYADSRQLGYGRVNLMNFGGNMGMLYPALLAEAIQDGPLILYATMACIAFPLGIGLGAHSRLAGNHEYGNASIITYLGETGIMYGTSLPMLFSSGFASRKLFEPAVSMRNPPCLQKTVKEYVSF